ncbi:MAG: hypothetical protein M3160_06040 [Candidatus Eremiobacteraeota bacterium]|nr:hypothetical protein [Candidatus Eremiobacteraeota bacterium]
MRQYTRIRPTRIYHNPWVGIEVHDILHPIGAESEHVLMVAPVASAILVIDEDDVLSGATSAFWSPSRDAITAAALLRYRIRSGMLTATPNLTK